MKSYKETNAGNELLNIANGWITRSHRLVECGFDVGVPSLHTYATFKLIIKKSGIDMDDKEVKIRNKLIDYIIDHTTKTLHGKMR